MSRRTLLLGGLGLGAAALTGCTSAPAAGPVPSASGPMPTLPPATPRPGQRIVEQVLTAKPVT
ncbi:MAG: multicopper oxidase family protein, partial [Propionibacteriaceae bacterium]|nr:multicopper oxidase family protein [Propionibacteriaceae bacterium]